MKDKRRPAFYLYLFVRILHILYGPNLKRTVVRIDYLPFLITFSILVSPQPSVDLSAALIELR